MDLPFPIKDVLAGVEMALLSPLHPDLFDSVAQQMLPKDIHIYCPPGEDGQVGQEVFPMSQAFMRGWMGAI